MTFYLTNVIGDKMAKFCNSADLMTSPQTHAAKDNKNRFIYTITALNFEIRSISKYMPPAVVFDWQSSIYSTTASILFMERYKAIYM